MLYKFYKDNKISFTLYPAHIMMCAGSEVPSAYHGRQRELHVKTLRSTVSAEF